MKLSLVISAIFAAMVSINTLADTNNCKPISGTIQPLTPDPTCKIMQSKFSHFPDTEFYEVPGSCFSGRLQGLIAGNIAVTGTSFSGFTVNNLGQLTGASVMHIYAGRIELGRLFTRDIIFDAEGDAKELLTVVEGSKLFRGASGNIELTGNTLYQTGSFTGTLCVEY